MLDKINWQITCYDRIDTQDLIDTTDIKKYKIK